MLSFSKRLGYFSFGLIIGIFLVRFFYQKKNIEFDYLPNDRTLKSIRNKPYLQYTETALKEMKLLKIDSADIQTILLYGKVNFKKSDTKSNPCKTYTIEPTQKTKSFSITVERCDSVSNIKSIYQ